MGEVSVIWGWIIVTQVVLLPVLGAMLLGSLRAQKRYNKELKDFVTHTVTRFSGRGRHR